MEPTPRRVTIPHVPALDGLRGVAVAGVLLFHGGHLKGGYLGVDLFFVLSGYLITSLLLAESRTRGAISLGGFWARRARRLLPALAGMLIGVALYAFVLGKPEDLAQIRGDALATIAYVANWRAVFTGHDYWALFRSPSPLEHTWSLAIEEQFYLVWPLLFAGLLAWRKTAVARAVLITSLVLAAVSATLMIVLYSPGDPSRVYYGTDTRAAAILLGAALAACGALWGPVRGAVARRALEGLGLAGVLWLGFAWVTLGGDSSALYRGGFLACGLAAVAVLAAASHPEAGVLARVLSWRPLCLLGLISYGVYLWHWPVDVVVDADRTGLTGWPLFAVQVACTLAVSIASFVLLERPIRHGALTARQWLWLTPATAVVLVAAVLATTTGAHSVAASAPPSHAATRGGVLVVGDSVAGTVVPGLVNAGLPVWDASIQGCRVVRGDVRTTEQFPDCPWTTLWKDSLRDSRPKTVLLVSGGWDLFDVKPPHQRRWLVPGTAAWADYYAGELQQAIDLLSSRGARVVIPTMPCFGHLVDARFKTDDRSAFNVARVAAANAVLARVAARNRGVVVTPDLNRLLCPLGRYQVALGSINPVRVDGVHFSQAGSDFVGSWLAPTLRAAMVTSTTTSAPATRAAAPAASSR